MYDWCNLDTKFPIVKQNDYIRYEKKLFAVIYSDKSPCENIGKYSPRDTNK
jgi:hypothetical protein